jgi:uncharacterized protein
MGLASATRRRLMAVTAVLLFGAPAFNAAHADTVLRLAETATVMVAPDELGATLRAEAVAPTAADAQRRVNEMMRDALAAAKKVDGITISTGGYGVWRTGPTPQDRTERWQAGQNLNLTGKDGASLLTLVGDLQQRGLVEGNLGWRLSRDAEHKARKEATREALAALRGRADDAADILGLRFDSFREVRLDNVSPPMTAPRLTLQRSAMAMAAAPPPSAEAEDLPVSASAEANVVLKPR